MSEIATPEQMYAVGAAMVRHAMTRAEAVELFVEAAGGVARPLTAAEAVELVDRLDTMPELIATRRGFACEAWWPFARQPRRGRRRTP